MKPQFTTMSILLVTAFVAIAVGAFMPLWDWFFDGDSLFNGVALLSDEIVWSMPVYFPIIFGAYAVGRRRLTWQIVLAFGVSSAIAYMVAWRWLYG